MEFDSDAQAPKEISCRITRTLLTYVRANNKGALGDLVDGLGVDETYLLDTQNWVSHSLLQILYGRMTGLLGDDRAVYKMALASERFQSLGLLDPIARLFGSPRLVFSQAPEYNKMLKLNGSVRIRDISDTHVLLEDRYHDSAQKTRFDCDYTRGILAGIPTMFGLPPAEVEELECQVPAETYGPRRWPDHPLQGRPACLFRVRWQPGRKRGFWKKWSGREKFYRRAIEDLKKANQLIQSKYEEAKKLSRDLQQAYGRISAAKIELEEQRTRWIDSERRYRQSEEKYRRLFENGSDLLCIHDLQGNLLETNLAHKEKYGWKKPDLEGINIREIIPERHRPGFDRYLARILETGEDEGIFKGCGKSGEEVILEYRNVLMRDPDGRPAAVHGAARDVTARVRTEKALIESRRRYRDLFEEAPIMYVLTENCGGVPIVTDTNNLFVETIGYSRDEILGKPLEHFYSEASRFELLNSGGYGRALAGSFGAEERELLGRDGSIIHTVLHARPETDDHGNVVGTRAMFTDITPQKKAEARRKSLESQLRHVQKMEAIGTLAGGIAHNFNNILSIIIGNSELAQDAIEPVHPVRENLDEILAASIRARDIVSQLLNFSRKGDSQMRPTAIQEIVRDALHLIRASLPSNIEIRLDIPVGLRPITADPSQIHQLMINLCTNAALAMEQTGGILEISLADVGLEDLDSTALFNVPPGRYVRLAVRDTGTGIDPDIQDKVFDPYFTTRDIAEGAGMGLAIVSGIVKRHNGGIALHSDPGSGTEVTVLFPADAEPTPAAALGDEAPPRGKETVLVVDDEVSLVKMTSRLLEQLGYQVEAFTNPIEALERFEADPSAYGAVVTDLTMPGMSGSQLSRRILKARPHMPIILCTGFSDRIDPKAAKDIGIAGYLAKPYGRSELAVALREVLDKG